MFLSDPLTKESFVPKRSNQKFSCRLNQIKYNNRKAKSKRLAKAPYDKILDANRNILIKIIGEEDDRIVSKDYLLGAGFVFGYFNKSMVQDNINYQCIYNYAITQLKDGKYKIYSM
jgi:hypothetical protein|tara:strand:+ start:132 stop:479 length:348 start_codon:yes stop_codon:yes gene_type:complete